MSSSSGRPFMVAAKLARQGVGLRPVEIPFAGVPEDLAIRQECEQVLFRLACSIFGPVFHASGNTPNNLLSSSRPSLP
ncbi:MAG: hypothetical protein ACU843_13430 [Gammaproteobacteria bacterium]